MGVFTDSVMLDPILKTLTMTSVHVVFQLRTRTNWHRHERGQLLKVTAGNGWGCDQGAVTAQDRWSGYRVVRAGLRELFGA